METANRRSRATPGAFAQQAIAWLTMFVVGCDLFAVSPLLPLISADYAVQPAAAGLSVTVFAVTYMLSAPALGHLADRVGRGRVLSYCLCAFAAANLLTAIAGNFTWLLAARIVAGAAAAGVSPSVYALIGSSAPPERRATRLAIVVSGLLLSLSLGAPISLLTAASLGWSIVFAALAALSLLLAWANSRVWHNTAAAGSRAALAQRLTAAVLAARLAPTVLWSTALYAVYTYLGDGLSASGYSTEQIAEVILFYGCGAIAGTLIGGRVADRLGARMTISISSRRTRFVPSPAVDCAALRSDRRLRLWARLAIGAVVLPGSAAQAGEPIPQQPGSDTGLEQQRPLSGNIAGLADWRASRRVRRLSDRSDHRGGHRNSRVAHKPGRPSTPCRGQDQAAASALRGRGRLIVTVVPDPSSLSIPSVPPCRSTTDFAKGSPRPAP